LEIKIPDLQERIDHIFHKQLYGIAITEITSLLSRRSLYCSKYPDSIYSVTKFDNSSGKIRFKHLRHTWVNNTCFFCGANKNQYKRSDDLETHAYEFIHTIKPEDILKMKFDVIISNPPYQLKDGGSGPSASPLYHKFIQNAKKLRPRFITMIIPSRWFAGGKGLDDFREEMLSDDRIKNIVDYPNSADCFAGVDIAGGVNYFLWARDYHGNCTVKTIRGNKNNCAVRALNEFDIFIRSNESIPIIHKILAKKEIMMDEIVCSRNPFGFSSNSRGKGAKDSNFYIRLIHSQGFGYVRSNEVLKNISLVKKWKVTIGKLVPSNGEVGIDPAKGYNAITIPRILKPDEVITDSYLVLATFNTKKEALNCAKYMTLKFPRFLMHETYSSMNISKGNFRFVPFLDFETEWTDEALYKRYGLGDKEIQFIENMIRPMELGGEANDE
jgi:hypothetical protein